MIGTVARRELLSLTRAPMAWTALAASQLILAWLFLVLTEAYLGIQGRVVGIEGTGVTDLVVAPLLRAAGGLLLILGPVITMSSIAGERRARTMDLPMSSPVSLSALVLGKFTAAGLFLGLVWLMTALMIGALTMGTTLDGGRIAASLLGLALLAGLGISVGILCSSLFPQPTAAALGGVALLFGLWVAGAGVEADSLTAWLLPSPRFDRLLTGLVNSADIAYFLLMVVAGLGFSMHLLDAGRAGGR